MLKSFHIPNILEAGTDEVGRGCLAGPVVAAAVVFPENFTHEWLTDSKMLSKRRREDLVDIIKSESISWAVEEVSHTIIDEINILNASILAMHHALDKLEVVPQHILVDGNKFKPYLEIPHTCFVKGDSKYLSIAAASILAKTYRDDLMCRLALEYPQYGWERNAGYPTKKHREGIVQCGLSPFHRRSFKQLPTQLSLFLSD
jgi:ribonuclease HII